jgi:uncharacterized damage-inducible protein DinB
MPEAWLRGPLPGIDAFLMPAAHAFVHAREDLPRAVTGLDTERLWRRPGGAASVGFHLLHIAGSTDRLLTYARGEALSDAQRLALAAEREPPADRDADGLLQAAFRALDAAVDQLRRTPRESLLEERRVGRAGTPSTVLGLVFHAAEHAARHAGQALATARAVRG